MKRKLLWLVVGTLAMFAAVANGQSASNLLDLPPVIEMLEAVPEKVDNPVVIEFRLDGSNEVIYRWRSKDNCWVKA